MKIKKNIGYRYFNFYYGVDKSGYLIYHGLYNDYNLIGIYYLYHNQEKGFSLKNKHWL